MNKIEFMLFMIIVFFIKFPGHSSLALRGEERITSTASLKNVSSIKIHEALSIFHCVGESKYYVRKNNFITASLKNASHNRYHYFSVHIT